jgi:hypothetical protein
MAVALRRWRRCEERRKVHSGCSEFVEVADKHHVANKHTHFNTYKYSNTNTNTNTNNLYVVKSNTPVCHVVYVT